MPRARVVAAMGRIKHYDKACRAESRRRRRSLRKGREAREKGEEGGKRSGNSAAMVLF